MFSTLREEDEDREEGSSSSSSSDSSSDKSESRLAYTIRRFYITLIYYSVRSVPFQSLVISFYTILSRRKLKSKSSNNRNNRAGIRNNKLDKTVQR